MNKNFLIYQFYSSLIFLYISDMGAMISIIWASLELTGNTIFLGSMLCISTLVPYVIKKIYTGESLSISNLYVLRAFFYVTILIITLLGIATEYSGFIITILLFGVVNILTLSVYETYNSYMVNNSYISSELASRIMQTVLQSGAFLGAIIAGVLIDKVGYETVIKIIAIYEIILNILFYFFNKSIESSRKKFTYSKSSFIIDNISTNQEIKFIYILCLPLGIIGIHISSFNILSTFIFQNINNWDSTLFGYASGLAGIGAFLASIVSFKKVHFIVYTFILILFDIVYSNTNFPLVAILSCFFIGFSINTIRISIRKHMLDIANSPLLSQKMGELSASSYVFFQSIGSIIIGIIISDNLAGEAFSRVLLPIIGIMIFLSSYISILTTKEKIMKNFIIVDPFSTGALLAPEISKKGHYVYSVLSNNHIPDFYKSSYTGEGFCNSSIMAIDKAKKKLKSIDGVIVGTESGVFAGDLLAEYFNVKGNSSDSSQLRRDKSLMQKTLKENGLNYIKSYEININNYISIINMLDINKEYVLKPKSSAGTDGVLYFKNKEILLKFIHDDIWKKTDLFGNVNNTYLIQEYISGKEFVVDMVVNNDDIFIASLCKYEKCYINNSKFVYKSLITLDPNDNRFEPLIDYAKQCAKALKIKHGPAHMELFYTTENKPIMIEVGARLHGGIAPLLFKECYEDNLLDTTVTYFIENKLPKNKKAKLNKNGKIIFLINSDENSLLDVESFKPKLSKLDSFVGAKIFFGNNEILPLTTDLTNIPGIVWLSHYDKKQIERDEFFIRSLFDKYLLKHNRSYL